MIVGALVIVGAAYLNTWLGVAAAILAVGGIVWWLMQEPVPRRAEPPPKLDPATPGRHAPRARRRAARDGSRCRVGDGATDIVVVVPALASTLEALTGAVDDRRAEAEETA